MKGEGGKGNIERLGLEGEWVNRKGLNTNLVMENGKEMSLI